MMRKKLIVFFTVVAMLTLCIAIGTFSVFAAEPSAQAGTKVYNVHAIENVHYQNQTSGSVGTVTPTPNGIELKTTVSADVKGIGACIGLFTEKADYYELTVAPGEMVELQKGAYSCLEFLFGARVGGNSRPTDDFTADNYMIYLQLNPKGGDYSKGVSAAVIAHNDKSGTNEQIWGQTSCDFPAGTNGEVKIEIAKNADSVYKLKINGTEFNDAELITQSIDSDKSRITINDVVAAVAQDSEKPYMSVSHVFGKKTASDTTLVSYVKTLNGANLKDLKDEVGGEITQEAEFDMKDWVDNSVRPDADTNHARISLTDNGIKLSGDFVNGNAGNGHPVILYNKAMPAGQDEYSVTVGDMVVSNASRASIWWANTTGQSWENASSSIMTQIYPSADGKSGIVQIFITKNERLDVAAATEVSYISTNGAVTVALRKTADGYVVVVNGTVASISAVDIAETLTKMSADGGIYFASDHDFDGDTNAGKFSHVIYEINGTKFVPANLTVEKGQDIEFTNSDWHNLSNGSNGCEFSYDGGLKLNATLKAGVNGVDGGLTALAYANPFANDEDEYSIKISIDDEFYIDGANFGKYTVYLADTPSENYTSGGKYIVITVEPEFGDITLGGNARVITNAVAGGDSGYVGIKADGKNVTVVIRKNNGVYDVYVNGSKMYFPDASTINTALGSMQSVYFGLQVEYKGVAATDTNSNLTLKEINGCSIVNETPDNVILANPAVTSSNVTKTSATLTWNAFNNSVFVGFDSGFAATKYVIERYSGETATGETTTFTVDSLDTPTYTDETLTADTAYTYKVSAVDANDLVLASYNTVTLTTVANTNFTALNDAINAAENLVDGVTVSADGANFATGSKYYLQADVDTYEAAIAAAKLVAQNADATQSEVDSALETLDTATSTFNAAEKTVTVDFTALNTAISTAESLVDGVTVSADGADLAAGAKYYLQADVDTYEATIAAATLVAENADATQSEVDSALEALNTATSTFNAAEKTVEQSEPEKGGCSGNVSIVGCGTVAVILAMAAVAIIKRKENG